MLDNLGNLERTHSCGDLRPGDIGNQVVLMGWVAKRRDFENSRLSIYAIAPV